MMPVDLASPPRPPAPGSRFRAAVRPRAKRDNVGASLPTRLVGGVDGRIALDGPAWPVVVAVGATAARDEGRRDARKVGNDPRPKLSGEVAAAPFGLRGVANRPALVGFRGGPAERAGMWGRPPAAGRGRGGRGGGG